MFCLPCLFCQQKSVPAYQRACNHCRVLPINANTPSPMKALARFPATRLLVRLRVLIAMADVGFSICLVLHLSGCLVCQDQEIWLSRLAGLICHFCRPHGTVGRMTMKLTRRVLCYSLVRLLASLTRLLAPLTRSFARLLTDSLRSGLCL